MNIVAALPYVSLGPWQVGPVTIESFGLLVAVGLFLAYELALRRAPRVGLEQQHMRSLLFYLLTCGFVGAHVFDMIFYHPEDVIRAPWTLLWIPAPLSSYGGIVGALIGMIIWSRRHREVRLLSYADVAAFVLPFGWFFGRVGCALVHDHPGRRTSFPLAVDFGAHPPGGGRHDLGLYEAAWWIVIISFFVVIDRIRARKADGLYLALLPLAYAPIRFMLDFLRIRPALGGDARYLGLTPAQYISITAFTGGLVLLRRWMRTRAAPLS